MKRIAALCLCTALIASCASPGVVSISPETYLITKTSAAGAFTNMSQLKADVIREANEFAAKQGKVAIPVSAQEITHVAFGMPRFEYQFRVVSKDDPEAKRTSLSPAK
jgi:hypothetical protein